MCFDTAYSKWNINFNLEPKLLKGLLLFEESLTACPVPTFIWTLSRTVMDLLGSYKICVIYFIEDGADWKSFQWPGSWNKSFLAFRWEATVLFPSRNFLKFSNRYIYKITEIMAGNDLSTLECLVVIWVTSFILRT